MASQAPRNDIGVDDIEMEHIANVSVVPEDITCDQRVLEIFEDLGASFEVDGTVSSLPLFNDSKSSSVCFFFHSRADHAWSSLFEDADVDLVVCIGMGAVWIFWIPAHLKILYMIGGLLVIHVTVLVFGQGGD